MEVRNEFPPNISDLVEKFPIGAFKPVFTYGDVLYNPTGGEISADLMRHEETHREQQKQLGVDVWWGLYLKDESFRLSQEAEAYQEQARFIKENYTRRYSRLLIPELVRNLSSKLYGNIINKQQAKELLNV